MISVLIADDQDLMDVRMPGLDGIQATAQLAHSGSRAKILMLTTFNLDEYVYHAMKAGASGFLHQKPGHPHLRRLGLRDRVQIAVYAYEHGIVRPGHRHGTPPSRRQTRPKP